MHRCPNGPFDRFMSIKSIDCYFFFLNVIKSSHWFAFLLHFFSFFNIFAFQNFMIEIAFVTRHRIELPNYCVDQTIRIELLYFHITIVFPMVRMIISSINSFIHSVLGVSQFSEDAQIRRLIIYFERSPFDFHFGTLFSSFPSSIQCHFCCRAVNQGSERSHKRCSKHSQSKSDTWHLNKARSVRVRMRGLQLIDHFPRSR